MGVVIIYFFCLISERLFFSSSKNDVNMSGKSVVIVILKHLGLPGPNKKISLNVCILNFCSTCSKSFRLSPLADFKGPPFLTPRGSDRPGSFPLRYFRV